MGTAGGTGEPDSFDELVDQVRSRLLPVLWSRWGVEVGSDIGAEVEEYAWSNRQRLLRMSNPLGFLYRVSQSRSRKYVRWSRRSTFPSRFADTVHEDPPLHDLLEELAGLTPDQRACVLLVHGFGWTYDQVAELLGMRRTAVNNHVHRGLGRLRSSAALPAAPTAAPPAEATIARSDSTSRRAPSLRPSSSTHEKEDRT